MESKQLIAIAVASIVVIAAGAAVAVFMFNGDDDEWKGEGVTDAAGNVVKLDADPVRIVSTSATSTEIICQLGYRSVLVGASSNPGVYSIDSDVTGIDVEFDYPGTIEADMESGKIANIGTYNAWTAESVLAANPDFVLMEHNQIENDSSRMDQIKTVGVPVFVISSGSTWDEILKNYTDLGKLLDKEDKAKEIVDEVRSSEKILLDEVTGKGNGLKVAHICYCFGKYYIYDTSPTIEAAIAFGATNAITTDQSFTTITVETIAEKNPDIIIFDDMATGLVWTDVIAQWKADPVMGKIDCIENDNFYCLEYDPFQSTSYNTVHYFEGEVLIASLLFGNDLGVEIPTVITDENWKSYLLWFEELVN